MSETCAICGREKWEYSGPARKPTNCMQDYDWCPPANTAEHWRLGYEREKARADAAEAYNAEVCTANEQACADQEAAGEALAAARRECEGLRKALSDLIQEMKFGGGCDGTDPSCDGCVAVEAARAALAAPADGEEGK